MEGVNLKQTPLTEEERALVCHDLKSICGKIVDMDRLMDALHEDLRQLIELNQTPVEDLTAEEDAADVQVAEPPVEATPVIAPRMASKSVAIPPKPAGTKPAPVVAKPTVQAAKPVSQAAKPAVQATKPTVPAAKPVAQAAKPAAPAARPPIRMPTKPLPKPSPVVAQAAEEAIEEVEGDDGGLLEGDELGKE